MFNAVIINIAVNIIIITIIYIIIIIHDHHHINNRGNCVFRFCFMSPLVLRCGMVTYRLERLACNVERTGLSFVQDSYCVETLSSFAQMHTVALLYYFICAAEAFKSTSDLPVRRAISKLSCICIVLRFQVKVK